jgi:cytochrome c biogenesis protein CcmG, thiol:disulfide interchange protein DsbE
VKRIAVPGVVVVVAAALVGLLVYGLVSKGEDRSIDDSVKRGQPIAAPGLGRALPVLDAAGTRSLASYHGKVVVLNFWASWCVPCRSETPLLERLQRRIAARGATVVGVNYRDTTTDANAFARRYGLTYPSLRDVDGDLAQDYGTRALPETFVIDRAGKVTAVSRGQVDAGFLDRTVDPLLSQ